MKEVKNFLLHLRLNYNFFILSAPFFLGAIFVPDISDGRIFLISFGVIYVFLFGGANVYNSYFDRDEGPIGGLEHPPKVETWMYYTSWVVQVVGLIISYFILPIFGLVYLLSMILFWLYSGPIFRFKGKPLLSFIAIGIATIFNSVILGYVMAGGVGMPTNLIVSAVGASFLILSMYPVSQAYQIDEDSRRGDVTFAVKYGIKGIKINFLILYLLGIILLSYSFLFNAYLGITTFVAGVVVYIFIWQKIKTISGRQSEYKPIMQLKYISGMIFTLTMIGLLLFL